MTRRKDGTLQQVITVNGKKVYFYGKTKAEVLCKITEYRCRKDTGRLYSEVAEEWWREKEPTLSPSTYDSYLRPYNMALAYFGDKPIASIRTADIAAFMKKVIAEHGMAHKTASNCLCPLRGILSYACMQGDMDADPSVYYKLPRGLKSSPRRASPSEDIQKIKAYDGSMMSLFCLMALYTGMRKGELLALSWEDVDLPGRVIHVTKAITYRGEEPVVKDPKTVTGIRDIGIPDKLAAVLVPGNGIIFNHDGGYMRRKHFTAAWNKFRAEKGLVSTPHCMRHAYASMLMDAQIPIKDAQALLGHAQASTTLDTYADIREARNAARIAHTLSLDID